MSLNKNGVYKKCETCASTEKFIAKNPFIERIYSLSTDG